MCVFLCAAHAHCFAYRIALKCMSVNIFIFSSSHFWPQIQFMRAHSFGCAWGGLVCNKKRFSRYIATTTMYATVLFHHNIVVVHFFFLFTKIHVQTIKVHTEMCECVLVYECDACKLLYCRIVVAIAILALWLHLFGYWQQLSVIAAQWLIIWKIFVKCFVFVVELYGSAGKQCNCHDQRTIKLLNCSCKL